MNKDMEKKEIRKFAIIIFLPLLAVGIFLREKGIISWIIWGCGLAILIMGLISPGNIRFVYKGWMKISVLLAFVTSHAMLAILFYLVVTPTGIIMKMLGKKLLIKTFDHNVETYWLKRDKRKRDKGQYEKMF